MKLGNFQLLYRIVYSRGSLIVLSLIILNSLLFATGYKQVQADVGYISSANWPVLFVHGWTINSAVDCNSTWAATENFLRRSHDVSGQQISWTGQFVTLGYYDNDQNCDDSLQNDDRTLTQCTNYFDESLGDNNESIRHLGCMLAWYIYDNYTTCAFPDAIHTGCTPTNVQLVAHSMGGLIVQYALYGVQQHFANFPDHLYVQDVVTFDTPFGGVVSNSLTNSYTFGNPLPVLENNIQAEQMQQGSTFMNEMQSSAAQNPQGAGPGTDWTMMGSIGYHDVNGVFLPCDELLLVATGFAVATYMNGGHKSLYESGCYDHGGMLDDENSNGNSEDSWNAYYFWCDGCPQTVAIADWTWDDIGPQPLFHMLYALYFPTW